jgi:hypothetical protein
MPMSGIATMTAKRSFSLISQRFPKGFNSHDCVLIATYLFLTVGSAGTGVCLERQYHQTNHDKTSSGKDDQANFKQKSGTM